MIASGDVNGSVRLCEIANQHIHTIGKHSSALQGLAFSPDGSVLASASQDKTIMLWDVARLERIATLEGHRQTVWSVAFSPDGRTLASGSSDGTVKLWSLPLGQEVATFSTSSANENKSANYAVMVAFSPDGNTLAARTWGGMLHVWRAVPFAELEHAKADQASANAARAKIP